MLAREGKIILKGEIPIKLNNKLNIRNHEDTNQLPVTA